MKPLLTFLLLTIGFAHAADIPSRSPSVPGPQAVRQSSPGGKFDAKLMR